MKYVKLDADDIMKILLEYYQERFDDSEMRDVDLVKIDSQMEYNGEHAFLRKNPEFFVE